MKTAAFDTPKQSPWRSPFGIALIGYYLVMAVLGLLIPEDILKANAWARDFSDFMASIVPQIDRITALNIAPDVNRFYFSVLWAGSPSVFIAVVLFFAQRPFNPKEWRQAGAPAYQSFFFLLASALWAGWWPQTLALVTPELRLTRLLFGAPLCRTLMTQLMFVTAPCLMLAVTPYSFAAWYRRPTTPIHPQRGCSQPAHQDQE